MSRSPTEGRRYFVVHPEEADCPSPGLRYEIQLCGRDGRAIAEGVADDLTQELTIAGHTVPRAVVEAARRQPMGQGDYVDAAGNSVPPF